MRRILEKGSRGSGGLKKQNNSKNRYPVFASPGRVANLSFLGRAGPSKVVVPEGKVVVLAETSMQKFGSQG